MKEKCLQFPERLTELRLSKKLTRQQMADMLGVSRASLEYYEKGLRAPDISVLYKLSETFDISADYLLGRTKEKGKTTEINSASKYTGLSTESIEALHKRKENSDKCKTTLKFFDEEWKKKSTTERITSENIKAFSNVRRACSKNKDEIYLFIIDELIKNNDFEFSNLLIDINEYLENAKFSAELAADFPDINTSDYGEYIKHNLFHHLICTLEKMENYYQKEGYRNGND